MFNKRALLHCQLRYCFVNFCKISPLQLWSCKRDNPTAETGTNLPAPQKKKYTIGIWRNMNLEKNKSTSSAEKEIYDMILEIKIPDK